MQPQFLKPAWKMPSNINAIITTRNIMGASIGNYSSFNIAAHVNDNIEHVLQNRVTLSNYLPSKPLWLNQAHTNNIINLIDYPNLINNIEVNQYDAIITQTRNQVLSIMTADCIPILVTDTNGSFVGAIHAGWRGVFNQLIKKFINNIKLTDIKKILIYLGPSICKHHFKVGQDVFDMMLNINYANKNFFTNINAINKINKYYCDLIGIVKLQLLNSGILNTNITISNLCTYCNSDIFYSYRKDKLTGRQASLIWMK